MSHFLLFDASAIVAGLIGPATGPSALVLATVRLGGFDACTTENAMEETRRQLLTYDNRHRSKVSFARVEQDLKALHECPTFTIYPWITSDPQLWPENTKDAYLLRAAELYRPSFLLTWDKALLEREAHAGAVIASPMLLLSAIDGLEDNDF